MSYTEPVPEHGDVMPVEDFRHAVRHGLFIDYDGYGYPARDGRCDESVCVLPSKVNDIPTDATHIVWFNR
jgi:hypothetical protein